MWFKSATQPLCRTCGKKIKKRTEVVWFGRNGPASDYGSYRPDDRPRSKAEAQRLVNQQVVSVSWRRAPDTTYGHVVGDPDFDYIDSVKVWDGETYEDGLFCTLACAATMGRSAATHHNLGMPAYHAAIAQQKGAAS